MQRLEVSDAVGVKRLIKIQLDATVYSPIYFTAKLLYMFRVSTAPIIRSTINCNFPQTWPGLSLPGHVEGK